MLRRFIPRLKQWACRHNADTGTGTVPNDFWPLRDYVVVRTETVGESLGWDARKHVMERALCHCNRCGGEWWTPPGYLPARYAAAFQLTPA